jgi:hypothetical protein
MVVDYLNLLSPEEQKRESKYVLSEISKNYHSQSTPEVTPQNIVDTRVVYSCKCNFVWKDEPDKKVMCPCGELMAVRK